MPPRDPSLPEGTDHIIDTNIDLGDSGASASGSGGGSNGGGGSDGRGESAGNDKETGSAFKFDKGDDDSVQHEGIAAGIVGQVKDQISSLKDNATDRVRSLADDGKGQATSFLQSLADVLSDAAGSIEDKLGDKYAGPGNSAAESVRSLADRLDDSSVEDLFEGAKKFVEKSPVLAIGAAALIGFAVARVLRSTISEFRGGGEDRGQSGSGTGSAAAA